LFANRYWPAVYLIDGRGYIRFQHHGEGSYAEIEQALAELVLEAARQRGEDLSPADLPRPLAPMREEDHPGAVCFRTTPELHAGYNQGALGNAEGYLPRSLPTLYQKPPASQRPEGSFYVTGVWRAGDEFLALAGDEGELALPYHAATANAVLSVSADPVELMLDLKPPITLEVTQDGQPLDALSAGADVRLADGRSWLVVDAPRMYELACNPDDRPHELRLRFSARGAAVYAFTFSTCVRPTAAGH
jgi:hypothetical protein